MKKIMFILTLMIVNIYDFAVAKEQVFKTVNLEVCNSDDILKKSGYPELVYPESYGFHKRFMSVVQDVVRNTNFNVHIINECLEDEWSEKPILRLTYRMTKLSNGIVFEIYLQGFGSYVPEGIPINFKFENKDIKSVLHFYSSHLMDGLIFVDPPDFLNKDSISMELGTKKTFNDPVIGEQLLRLKLTFGLALYSGPDAWPFALTQSNKIKDLYAQIPKDHHNEGQSSSFESLSHMFANYVIRKTIGSEIDVREYLDMAEKFTLNQTLRRIQIYEQLLRPGISKVDLKKYINDNRELLFLLEGSDFDYMLTDLIDAKDIQFVRPRN